MYYLISYDITHNSLRSRIASLLERHDCQRLQKSVFIAELNAVLLKRLYADLLTETSTDNFADEDNIVIIPVEAHSFGQIMQIGNNQTINDLNDRPDTIFF